MADELTLKEGDWQKQVIDYAQLRGWKVAHFRPAKTERGWRTPVSADGKGFPDLVLVRPPEILFVELKADKGKLRAEQKDWLEKIERVEVEARHAFREYGVPIFVQTYVWRPSDVDEVLGILR